MPKHVLKGKNIPINLWLPIHEVESEAIDQLKNITTLPWVAHLAVMPDCHAGKGCTVGSVIGMRGALSPATVGVDIGCLDRDSEYLSPTGWRKISQYDGGEVLGYDPATDSAVFVQPEAYIQKPYSELLHFSSSKGLDLMVSPDHKMLYWFGVKARGFRPETMSADTLATKHKALTKGVQGGFKASFFTKEGRLGMTPEQVRVQVMISADGTLRERKIIENKVELHFSKQRKIERCEFLLKAADLQFSRYNHKDGTVSFMFVPPSWSKDLGFLFEAGREQLLAAAEESILWDGSDKTIEGSRRTYYCSTVKRNADAIQYAYSATGVRAGIYKQEYPDKNWNPCYYVIPTKNSFVNLPSEGGVTLVTSPDGMAYCFTMPTGFFVMRRNNNVSVTGNCGMAAIKTNITASDLPESLAALRSDLEAAVPVGFNEHSASTLKNAGKRAFKQATSLMADFRKLTKKVQDLEGKAGRQLGTLGGGNHFIEVCIDGDQNVWLMLHSGSRNIGKCIAEYHISEAQKLIHNQALHDKDLAVFLAGTPEMKAYRDDLLWAQNYAATNRAVMLDLCKNVLTSYFPQIKFEEPIQCHHNYVSEEEDFGEQLYVTRKGAIRAGHGEMGIIPSAMGQTSYIVRGLGNADALCSASHGSGRRMSRGKAKKMFTVEDLAEQTAGVECRKDAAVVDEIPGAYKDIEHVMANQSDLVEIVAGIKAILCVKG